MSWNISCFKLCVLAQIKFQKKIIFYKKKTVYKLEIGL
jgi:hypothetical protein